MEQIKKDKNVFKAPVGSVFSGLPLSTQDGALSNWVCHCGKEAWYKVEGQFFCVDHYDWKY